MVACPIPRVDERRTTSKAILVMFRANVYFLTTLSFLWRVRLWLLDSEFTPVAEQNSTRRLDHRKQTLYGSSDEVEIVLKYMYKAAKASTSPHLRSFVASTNDGCDFDSSANMMVGLS